MRMGCGTPSPKAIRLLLLQGRKCAQQFRRIVREHAPEKGLIGLAAEPKRQASASDDLEPDIAAADEHLESRIGERIGAALHDAQALLEKLEVGVEHEHHAGARTWSKPRLICRGSSQIGG